MQAPGLQVNGLSLGARFCPNPLAGVISILLSTLAVLFTRLCLYAFPAQCQSCPSASSPNILGPVRGIANHCRAVILQ